MYLITPAFSGIFGLIFLALWLILALITIIGLVRTPWLNIPARILWITVIMVVPVLGALVYLFWVKVKRVNS